MIELLYALLCYLIFGILICWGAGDFDNDKNSKSEW
jgi:hypothetical protein